MFQMLARRGSAPPLSEQPSFDVHPAFVEFFGAAEPLDLYGRIGPIDHELVALAVGGGTDLAADDAFGAAEEADHATSIGRAIERCRG